MSPVDNREQRLYGLRYANIASRIGEADAFHEERGYWLWDPQAQQLMRYFVAPRGITVIAGGPSTANAKQFSLTTDPGSRTFGICSSPFIDRDFQTVRNERTITDNDDTFRYEEDTQLRMPGKPDIFHHRDRNTLRRVQSRC